MPPRRIGTENSATRAALIEAAARVIREKGYAAVTAREIAVEARLKPQLVHYYFRTMNDLLLAVLQYGADERLRCLAEAVFSDEPLRALWELNRESTSTALQLEFAALANHQPVIRAEVRRYAEKYRKIEIEALARHLELRGTPVPIPPAVLALLVTSLSQVLVREEALGMSVGHKEAEAFIEGWLRRLSGVRERVRVKPATVRQRTAARPKRRRKAGL